MSIYQVSVSQAQNSVGLREESAEANDMSWPFLGRVGELIYKIIKVRRSPAHSNKVRVFCAPELFIQYGQHQRSEAGLTKTIKNELQRHGILLDFVIV